MALLLYLMPWMGCLHLALLYPTGEDPGPLIARYGDLHLAKRDVIPPFEHYLRSALLMAQMPKESQKQRKKAVDSTFIRFGRSSWPGSDRHVDDATPVKEIGYFTEDRGGLMNSERMSSRNTVTSSGEVEVVPEILSPQDSSSESIPSSGFQQGGCRLASNGDLMRALIGNSCVRFSQKVKRENVNDTFIRFGKRDSSRRIVRSSDERTRHDT